MPALAILSDSLAFFLEVAALAAIATGLHRLIGQPVLDWIVPVAAVIAVVAQWGRYAAPKSGRRLEGGALIAFKLFVFALAAAALWPVLGPIWAAAFALLALAHLALAAAVGRL